MIFSPVHHSAQRAAPPFAKGGGGDFRAFRLYLAMKTGNYMRHKNPPKSPFKKGDFPADAAAAGFWNTRGSLQNKAEFAERNEWVTMVMRNCDFQPHAPFHAAGGSPLCKGGRGGFPGFQTIFCHIKQSIICATKIPLNPPLKRGTFRPALLRRVFGIRAGHSKTRRNLLSGMSGSQWWMRTCDFQPHAPFGAAGGSPLCKGGRGGIFGLSGSILL